METDGTLADQVIPERQVIEVRTTIEVRLRSGGVLKMDLDEAIELKDALIRAVGAQTPSYARLAPAAPRPGGFLRTDIPDHLLARAEAARVKAAEAPRCQCGEPGWGVNGCCGVSGCNNVPA